MFCSKALQKMNVVCTNFETSVAREEHNLAARPNRVDLGLLEGIFY